MSRWKILPAIIRGRQIGLRVLAGLRNVLQLQRSRSDFRHGGGAGVGGGGGGVTLSALSDDLGDRQQIISS